MDTKCGVMESEIKVREMIDIFAREMKIGKTVRVDLIEKSKHHDGETMLHLSIKENDDISIWHIELSCAGTFCYQFDDGIS
jgi:hypothetical protein